MDALKIVLRNRLQAFLADPVMLDSVQSPASIVDPAPRSAEALYCEIARARLQDQMAVVTAFDTKSSTMLTIASTVLPLTASLILSGGGGLGKSGILANHPFSQNALEVAVIFYVLLVVAFLRVLNYGGWDARPDLAQWQELTPGQAEETMFRRLGDACVEAYLRN